MKGGRNFILNLKRTSKAQLRFKAIGKKVSRTHLQSLLAEIDTEACHKSFEAILENSVLENDRHLPSTTDLELCCVLVNLLPRPAHLWFALDIGFCYNGHTTTKS